MTLPSRSSSRSPLMFRAIVVLVAVACSTPCRSADAPPSLTADEMAFLEELIDELLFDPKGAEPVQVPFVFRSVQAKSVESELVAWLRRDKAGRPREIFVVDRRAFPAPDEKRIKKHDFVAHCKIRYVVPDVADKHAERR